ncbi:MAG: PAS domain-containing protein [Acidobacteriota bacterium]|nr:PAS domain-containing protein [Acidobacteriota bacterium]
MTTSTTQISYPSALRRIVHPPLREPRFWMIQGVVLVIVVAHFFLDFNARLAGGPFASAIPVAILVLPIGYAGLRFGLAGSFATAVWATLLWLPDLLLPHNEGHPGSDLTNLVIVLIVSFVFGQRMESERITHQRVEETTRRALAVEAGYRRLFETNRAPTLVLDADDVVTDANPAAHDLLGPRLLGRSANTLFEGQESLAALSGQVVSLANHHDFRLDVISLPGGVDGRERQVTFEDVTLERTEQRRARDFAQRVVEVEEDQRRRLSRELHDEPLQLFLHLARRLEVLAGDGGVPGHVAAGLGEARGQALDAASRLRSLARDLRPPALDQLGLVPALSSLVAEIDDGEGPDADLRVAGTARRLRPDIELAAFRIVQESLRNALRHAHARHLDVLVAFGEHALALRVADDGRGFDPHATRAASPSPSLGLVGMGERARLLGGELRVDSAPGSGTVIDVALPLDETSTPTISSSPRRDATGSLA